MHDAALIADTFGLDPAAVLDERDPLRRLVRIAAHNTVLAARAAAARRQRPPTPGTSPTQ